MSQKCPNCQRPVSKKWLLFGFHSTDYKCPECKHTLRWTGYRLLVNFISGLIFALPILFLKYWDISYFELIPLMLLAAVLLMLYFPGQFRDMGKK